MAVIENVLSNKPLLKLLKYVDFSFVIVGIQRCLMFNLTYLILYKTNSALIHVCIIDNIVHYNITTSNGFNCAYICKINMVRFCDCFLVFFFEKNYLLLSCATSVRPSVEIISFRGNSLSNRPIYLKIGLNVREVVVHVRKAWFFEIRIASCHFFAIYVAIHANCETASGTGQSTRDTISIHNDYNAMYSIFFNINFF